MSIRPLTTTTVTLVLTLIAAAPASADTITLADSYGMTTGRLVSACSFWAVFWCQPCGLAISRLPIPRWAATRMCCLPPHAPAGEGWIVTA